MKLTVPELLKVRGWTAYELSKRSEGKISISAAYRLADGEWKCLSAAVLDGLCIAFEIEDPGPLFKRTPAKRRGKPG
jgi:hypothetical protein